LHHALHASLTVFPGMVRNSTKIAVLGAACLLAGCSTVSDTLFPSRSAERRAPPLSAAAPAPAPQTVQIAQTPTVDQSPLSPAPLPPTLGTTNFQTSQIPPFTNTGTFVGQKVQQLRGELATLQSNINTQNERLQQVRNQLVSTSQRYHATVAAVTTRLQVGTTPGNPVLVNQWNLAQAELDRLAGEINQLNSLANSVANDSAFSAFLLESTRATFGLAGAIDEDHRQLAILEDETNRTVVLIDRLLNELSDDVSRQTAYVGNERSNLTTLSLAIKNGEMFGPSLANRAFSAAQLSAAPQALASFGPPTRGAPAAAIGNRRPLVVIRFDRPDVPYQQALYSAVSRAVEQRPTAQFDLVAVAPNRGSPAEVSLAGNRSKQYAEQVLRSLTDMGLPGNRVNISSATSGEAFANEVHIYVR